MRAPDKKNERGGKIIVLSPTWTDELGCLPQ